MKNIAVLGRGQVGRAIIHTLLNLGKNVVSLDCSPKDLSHFSIVEDISNKSFFDLDKGDREELKNCDCVISTLPYFLNVNAADFFIKYHVPYFDLGGSNITSLNINKLASRNKSLVMTDVGLAPGIVNIWAEEGADILKKPKNISMYCGGIPIIPKKGDLFKYNMTWSGDGLYNEYKDSCVVLKNGEIVKVESLSGYEIFSDGLEAFCTSGGAAHTIRSMKQLGADNCSYKTLRYIGHRDLVYKYIKEKKYSRDEFCSLLEKDPAVEDQVIIKVQVENMEGKLFAKREYVYGDERFSAMQRATAFGAIAAMFSVSLNNDRPLNYSDVNYRLFNLLFDMLNKNKDTKLWPTI